MFLLHTVEHSFPLGYSLCFITHFPCAVTLYLYVLSGDGFFPCLRISPLHSLMFEHHYNTPPWLQLDPYKALVWLFLNLSSIVYISSPQHYQMHSVFHHKNTVAQLYSMKYMHFLHQFFRWMNSVTEVENIPSCFNFSLIQLMSLNISSLFLSLFFLCFVQNTSFFIPFRKTLPSSNDKQLISL